MPVTRGPLRAPLHCVKFKFEVMFKFDAEVMIEVRRRVRRGVEVACRRFIVDFSGRPSDPSGQ